MLMLVDDNRPGGPFVNGLEHASYGSVENLDMTGKIDIGWMSLMSARNSEINGEIFNFKHSGVDLRNGITGVGTLNCDLSTGSFSIGTIACGESWP